MTTMRLGTLNDLRNALGGDVGITYCAAVKKAAGFAGRKFDIEGAVKFLKRNPTWTMMEVYPRRQRNQPGRRSASADKPGARA